MRGNRGVALCLMGALCAAAQAVTIDWVTVGDAGNAPDDTGYGAVDHSYRISMYETTNAQYREFLNAKAAIGDPNGLYNTDMAGTFGGISRTGSGTALDPWVYTAKGGDTNWDGRPVNYVSVWDAARFANWLHNGQGGGDTESGAYINVGNEHTFARQPGAILFLPTEDEWYKAAYYKGGGLNAGYWDYPTKSDTAPTLEAPAGTDMVNGSANYWGGAPVDPLYYVTPVGAYTAKPSTSAYGTFDQGGNVWEWNETAVEEFARGIRGGSWGHTAIYMSAEFRFMGVGPSNEDRLFGFRLAASPESTATPEPATVGLLGLGLAAMLRRRRRLA